MSTRVFIDTQTIGVVTANLVPFETVQCRSHHRTVTADALAAVGAGLRQAHGTPVSLGPQPYGLKDPLSYEVRHLCTIFLTNFRTTSLVSSLGSDHAE